MIYIPEARVRQLLDWNTTYDAIERAMESVAKRRAFQNSRSITQLAATPNLLYTMPGYLADVKYGALGCKLVTYFPDNQKTSDLPSIMANILLMDDQTGQLKAVVAGTEITNWRTAAASAVATKHLKKSENAKILAIVGAGAQGKIHALAFQHFFDFQEVRIWNRTPDRARSLVDELSQMDGVKGKFVACKDVEGCVRGADVVVTATAGAETVVKFEWLKKGVHINAVGVGPKRELDDLTYRSADIFIDYWNGAENELKNLRELGVQFKAQIGDLIAGVASAPGPDATTVFQSLGMAVEDCAMARVIYDLHVQTSV